MVYSTPKAADFDAWINGGKLAPYDPIGLEYRWAAAGMVEREFCFNMLACNRADKAVIRRRLQAANAGRKVKVVLAGECVQCCGTGSVDSGGSNPDGTWIYVPCECLHEESQ